MDIVSWVEGISQAVPVPVLWLLGMSFALIESGLGLGFFIPGETVVLILSATMSEWPQALGMAAAVALGASLGDHVGYFVGRRFGPALRETKLMRRIGQSHWDRAVEILKRRGAAAVFYTRLLPVVRTLTPAAAGVAHVRYLSFLPASLAGATLWAGVYVGVGFSVRGSLAGIQQLLGDIGLYVVLGLAAAVAIFLVVRSVLRKRRGVSVESHVASDHVAVSPEDDARAATAETTGRTPKWAGAGYVRQFAGRVTQGQPWRTIPNYITLVRIVLLPVLLVLLARQLYTAALIFGLVVFISDFADGFIARRTRATSPLGAWLDPVADRLAGITVALGLGLGQVIPFEYVWLLLIPDVALMIIAAVAFRGTPPIAVITIGKVRTALIFGGFALMLLGMSLQEWGTVALSGLVGAGFFVALVGLVLHYVAAAQYARLLIARWTRGSATTAEGTAKPSAG
ncbi:CDP-alcohol phosphatidyltransferase family protein [Mycetocola saprophilus]|uniref:CDP-alcohol phosphatidyltransferase family protein n=1 Tax=Mycetocola saprophilus TaxID=76636 RepID=UPI003BF07325